MGDQQRQQKERTLGAQTGLGQFPHRTPSLCFLTHESEGVPCLALRGHQEMFVLVCSCSLLGGSPLTVIPEFLSWAEAKR